MSGWKFIWSRGERTEGTSGVKINGSWKPAKIKKLWPFPRRRPVVAKAGRREAVFFWAPPRSALSHIRGPRRQKPKNGTHARPVAPPKNVSSPPRAIFRLVSSAPCVPLEEKRLPQTPPRTNGPVPPRPPKTFLPRQTGRSNSRPPPRLGEPGFWVAWSLPRKPSWSLPLALSFLERCGGKSKLEILSNDLCLLCFTVRWGFRK